MTITWHLDEWYIKLNIRCTSYVGWLVHNRFKECSLILFKTFYGINYAYLLPFLWQSPRSWRTSKYRQCRDHLQITATSLHVQFPIESKKEKQKNPKMKNQWTPKRIHSDTDVLEASSANVCSEVKNNWKTSQFLFTPRILFKEFRRAKLEKWGKKRIIPEQNPEILV